MLEEGFELSPIIFNTNSKHRPTHQSLGKLTIRRYDDFISPVIFSLSGSQIYEEETPDLFTERITKSQSDYSRKYASEHQQASRQECNSRTSGKPAFTCFCRSRPRSPLI